MRLWRSVRSAPPPVRTIPDSAISAASSGGDCSSASLIDRIIASRGSSSAANTSSLGRYIISRDSILPEIRPINFKNKSNVKSNKTLRLRIKDDKSGIKNYKAYINGKWALFEYEPKQNLIFHDLSDSVIEDGENDLLIEFEDGVGNKQTYNTKIYY